ncbi:MAG: peptide ABC transporter [Candidatus Rokubacteria bacterium 13_1_40CM_68_15]|nr:MAG: peptide ABC transporter [Candidatus Rokubacteria bacterium 13_1_40CM_68_15]
MTRYIAGRVLVLGVLLFGLLCITFVISHVIPGDPARLAAGPDASDAMVRTLRAQYGLDRPLGAQFVVYTRGLLRGDFGLSLRSRNAVAEDLARFFPNTLELVTLSLLLAIVVGVPLGMLSAVYRDTWIDHWSRVMSVSGVAVPAFWLGLMLQLVIALHLGWLPLGGRLNLTTALPQPITHLLLVDATLRGEWATLGDGLRHAVLPVVTLCFPALASILRVNRAEMIETLHQDYILNARAQGLGGVRVVAKYALRNAMIPTLTMIGLRYGWMLGGTLLVESVFDWPGIGLYAVNSALSSDFVPVMGVTLVIGLNFMLANLLVDLGYAWLDPRLRRTAA